MMNFKRKNLIFLFYLLSVSILSSQNSGKQEDSTYYPKIKVAIRTKQGLKQDSLLRDELKYADTLSLKNNPEYIIAFNLCVNQNGVVTYMTFNSMNSTLRDAKAVRMFYKIVSKTEFEKVDEPKVCDVFYIKHDQSVENLYYRN